MAFEAKFEERKNSCDFCKKKLEKGPDSLWFKAWDTKNKRVTHTGEEKSTPIWITLHRECYLKLKNWLEKQK